VKRLSIVLVSLLLVSTVLLSACAQKPVETQAPVVTEAPATVAPTVAEMPTIRVATDATFKPFEYTDDAGNMIGIDIDLMNQIAEKIGVKIEWVNLPFDSALAGISECQYDAVIAAISITDERKAAMLFSEPYMTAGLVVVVPADNTTINGLADLDGKTVAAQLGTTGEQTAQAIPNVVYKPYDSYELAFLDLANKQIDAVVADSPVAAGYVKANPDKIKMAGEVFDAADYGIAICKTNTELQTKINSALSELIAAGVVDDLSKKYNP
jgi:ABC-type amino acid transport substrate-binding protein